MSALPRAQACLAMLLAKANPVSDLGLLETKACRNGLAIGTLQADFNDFFLKSQTVFRHEAPKGEGVQNFV